MPVPAEDGYSVQDDPALRVVDLTLFEGHALRRVSAAAGEAIDLAASGARPGSTLTAALEELGGRHDTAYRADENDIERAGAAAREAVGAYVTGDGEMARQYGPFPVTPAHPLLPGFVEQIPVVLPIPFLFPR